MRDDNVRNTNILSFTFGNKNQTEQTNKTLHDKNV